MGAPMFSDYDEMRVLSGSQKVAALLLSMGKPLAARLLKHFDHVELREITRAAAQLGAVSRTSLETIIDSFTDDFSSGIDLQGNVGEVELLLTETLPAEQAADILSDVFGSSNSSLWEKLSSLADSKLPDYIEKEHPQAIAFILSKVSPNCAATVLAKLPRDLRNDALRRMIAPEPVSDEALRIVETALQGDLIRAAGSAGSVDSRLRVADIVNKFEPADVEDVMQSMRESRPKDAAILKKMLFTFDDLLRLSVRARSTLFDNVATETIVLALRGTETEFRDGVLSSMASRARRLVESELNNGAAVPQRDIAKARRTIADTVLKMAQRHEIEISITDDVEAA